ncbi:hypothetical protein C366_00471 [Cryptococcus neoformans Tu401-1]|nr:hypothetical protein AYX15_00668 [Cryptococcus neoformans var. grubii]OWZ80646.1 hypothetical protein C365_00468 [Cryptococcus neoformans var. grubii Bt85]OXG23570.1 hypothetical protein C366_00471 [Cryptococcus neoformans var. grubii Tu401-1]OXM81503.1 hypothetical protein C364_00471 [Cryptococcus neoformans var. grubii Bt63]
MSGNNDNSEKSESKRTLYSIIFNNDPSAATGPISMARSRRQDIATDKCPLHLLAFNILPHPAKTNNPADLTGEPAEHGGLQSASANAYNAKPPYIPNKEIAEGLEKPKTREELRAEAQQLNS